MNALMDLSAQPDTSTEANVVEETVESVTDVDSKSDTIKFVASTFDEIAQYMLDYEVEHTVRLVVRKVTGVFNTNFSRFL